ncbi:AAA family ATPase [Veronia pacifica]|uniref:Helicase ATP-binding domain-containing protein n=1 Tax=Veronia pacifica TaxID=1080227 RepID=A0A1C3EQ85_9GAMM|nr:DEAD/DEAH box helicase family protein [Veronia pacifica]ODA35359.1 hypothetical protein A8L45_04125 [Veronia pacifica]
MGREAIRIVEIMDYYKDLLAIKPLTQYGVKKIVDCLIPQVYNKACWISRIKDDNRTWLKLTDDQIYISKKAMDKQRTIITGWPGSGKTIVLIHVCRQLAVQGKKTLVVTFNRLLSNKISDELKGTSDCKVFSFNKLCTEYSEEGVFTFCIEESLRNIVKQNKLSEFDVLLVDEGQAISEESWRLFEECFRDKKIVVMCDDAQAFGYENSVNLAFLESLMNVKAFLLTESMRMPKAVCEELKLFSTPDYSVINRREFEKDTLNRVVTFDQSEKLKKAIARLLSDGIAKSDICILKPAKVTVPIDLVPVGIELENIGKYRGLEKPIVIIYAPSDMSQTDFFCAYSRATSRCIVILSANHIQYGDYGELGRLIYKKDPERVKSLAEKGLLKNKIFSKHSGLKFNLEIRDILNLYWCEKWNSYFFYSEKYPLLQELILCHLEVTHIDGIISWTDRSLNHFRVSGNKNITLRSRVSDYELNNCSKCGCEVISDFGCGNCDDNFSFYDMICSKNEIKNRFSKIINIIKGEETLSKESKNNISPFLSASLLVMNKLDDFIKYEILSIINKADNYITKTIIIHIFYLIFNNKHNKDILIINKSVIDFVKRCSPSIRNELSDASIAAFVSNSIVFLESSNILKKIGKGKFVVIIKVI